MIAIRFNLASYYCSIYSQKKMNGTIMFRLFLDVEILWKRIFILMFEHDVLPCTSSHCHYIIIDIKYMTDRKSFENFLSKYYFLGWSGRRSYGGYHGHLWWTQVKLFAHQRLKIICLVATVKYFLFRPSTGIPVLHSGSHFRHGLLQLMIHTIDPLHDGSSNFGSYSYLLIDS